MSVVKIPDLTFSGSYYPQILDALVRFKRQNVPELTDESDFEPLMQMLRAFALVGHLNNVLLDLVANESTLSTARLPETVRNMLRLIGYEMSPASPANVDVLYLLSKVFAAPFEVVPAGSQVATENDGVSPVVIFECLQALTVSRTDQFTKVAADDGLGVLTDHTAAANAPATSWTPWATPAVGSAVYFGHDSAMWGVLDLAVLVAAANLAGVWEFYDGDFAKSAPTSVANLGGSLRFDLTSYLGTSNRAGTKIRVALNKTGAYQDVVSAWSGSLNYADTGFLGQTAASVVAADYTVGSDWQPLQQVVDGTAGLSASGALSYALPQALQQAWRQTAVGGLSAWWLRFRVTSVAVPTAPTLRRARMDTGKQWVLRSVVQGQTAVEDPLGSSTGLPNQRFETANDNFVWGSEVVTVDGVAWVRVDNFLASEPTDNHYLAVLGENDRMTVVFSDGNAGRVPPIGVGNVRASYRWGADKNGNVGASSVIVDKTGLTYVSSVENPRQGSGWSAAQGSDAASLERTKVQGAASFRVREVALGPSDMEAMAVGFKAADGSRPFARARAFEEGYGPKTVEVIVVAGGGNLATSAQLLELQRHFNGDSSEHPPLAKHIVANQESVVTNYTPKVVDIVVTVTAPTDVSAAVASRLAQVFQPDALKDDGVTYQWEFGGAVPTSRVIAEVFGADPSITRAVLATPAADLVLSARELPKIGTVSVTVVAP